MSLRTTLLSGFTFFAVVLLLPLRLQIVNHNSPATAGLHMLPLLFATGIGSFAAGGVSRKLQSTSFTFIVGSSLILLGTGLLTTLPPLPSISHELYGFQVLLGLGVGMVFSSVSVTVSIRVEPRSQSVIQGIASQSRLLGGSIGVAAANAMTNRQAHSRLEGILAPSQISSLQFSTGVLNALNATQKEAVRLTYASVWKETMKICVYIAAGAFLVSLCTMETRSIKLKRTKELVHEEKP